MYFLCTLKYNHYFLCKGEDELFIEDLVNEERSKRQGNKQKKKQKNHRNKQKNKSGRYVRSYVHQAKF